MALRCALALLAVCVAAGDANLAAYLKRREEFLQAEDALMDGSGLKLSQAEQEFDRWLNSTVGRMIQEYKKERLVDRFVPATYFPKVRAHIENTTLYKVLRKMPKGGALHLHFSSATSLEWIVDKGLLLPGCHVYWPTDMGLGKSSAAPPVPKGTLAFYSSSQAIPPGYLPAKKLLQKAGFKADLLKLLIIQEEDEMLTSPQIWSKFADVFVRLGNFFTNRLAVEEYLRATLQDFLADGVSHVELRIDLFHDGGLYDLDGREYQGADKIDVYTRVISEMQKSAPHLTCKMIASSVRMKAPEEMAKDLIFAFEVKKQRPDFIVGWDAPGEEDIGRPTLDYASELLQMQNLSKNYGVDLPLMLHDGESDWSTLNTVDAVLLGAKRLGHGFNLLSHPLLMEEVRKRGVAIEVCPISNQVLRYLTDLRVHPGARMIENGLPVTISSDDPGIWGARGLTHDFWEATVAWQLNTRTLKTLARNSLEFSGLTGVEKDAALRSWEQDWDHFMTAWKHLVADELPVFV